MSRKSKITFYPDLTVEENAKINGVSVHGIYFYLKAHQIDIKKKTTDGIVRELKKLIEINPKITQRELARITGHSTATINKHIKEAKRKENPVKAEIDSLLEIEHKNTENLKKNPKYYPTPTKQDLSKTDHEHYDAAHNLCVAFRRKGDLWKDLQIPFGNMNGGFPFEMNGVVFPTSEHAYISGIFSNNTPKHFDLQKRLLKIGSGYMAKRDIRAKNKNQWRKDWEEFNIEWMLYCVWEKAKQNEKFRSLLMATPRNAMIIEDVSFQRKPKSGKDTSIVWGCRNQAKKTFGKLAKKYAKSLCLKAKKAISDTENELLWDYCNVGEYVGQNIMGKILTIIKNCLHEGTEPEIDYALLNSKNIYLLGKKLDFKQEKPTKVIAEKKTKQNRVYGIIGAIIGDMVGSRFEFSEKRHPKKKSGFGLFAKDSIFTDDTVLTTALADAILHKKPYAETIGTWGKRYLNAGFSKEFIKWANGDWNIQGKSICDGAGMRISPVGFKGNSIEDVLSMAKEATMPTHNSVAGIRAAQAIAISIFLARNGKTKEEIKQYVETNFNYKLDLSHESIREMVLTDDRKNRKLMLAEYATPMAITAFLTGDDYEDVLRNAVMYGGDTDTVCSMAGAIAAAYYGVPVEFIKEAEKRMPQEMLDVINEFDGTSMSIHRITPPNAKRWSVDYVIIVYGCNVEGIDGEGGISYTLPSRHQYIPLKGFPIHTIGTTMDVIKEDVKSLIAKVDSEPRTTFIIENVGISKKSNIGIENMAPLFKPLVDKENVYFTEEYWDYFNSLKD